MSFARGFAVMFAGGLLAGCAVGPDYERPEFDVAASYKEGGDWKPSEPNDVLSRGPWWRIYNDDVLDGLEKRIEISNLNVRAAAHAVEESRALVSQARAGFWPTITGTASRPRTTTNPAGAGAVHRTQNEASLDGVWSLDIWGQIRR